MAFKKQFKEPILDATKTTTLRGSTKLRPGDEVAFTCEWGQRPFALASITEIEDVTLSDLTEKDAHADGFADRDALLEFIASLYGDRENFVRIRFACLQGAVT